MLLVRISAACLSFFALISCTPTTPPVVEYEGMIFLEDLMSPRDISNVYRPSATGALDSYRDKFKTRLLINVDGKVKKTTFLEGNRILWLHWNKAFLHFEFNDFPKAIPGPWEVDIIVRHDYPYTLVVKFLPVSYRTAVQKSVI